MDPEHHPAMAVSMATDVGRVRKNNEDFVGVGRVVRNGLDYSIWVVADGVGGGPDGEKASQLAVEAVIDHVTRTGWTDPATALTQAFGIANERVYEITGNGAAATTMVAALASDVDGSVIVANVGDSRAYVVSNGQAHPVTDDHSLVAERVAAGRISAEEERSAPDRNILTRGVGSEPDLDVDVFGPMPLPAGQRLVLCTDGVHGMIDDRAIGRISARMPIAHSAQALVDAAVEAGGGDNATALVGGYPDPR